MVIKSPPKTYYLKVRPPLPPLRLFFFVGQQVYAPRPVDRVQFRGRFYELLDGFQKGTLEIRWSLRLAGGSCVIDGEVFAPRFSDRPRIWCSILPAPWRHFFSISATRPPRLECLWRLPQKGASSFRRVMGVFFRFLVFFFPTLFAQE